MKVLKAEGIMNVYDFARIYGSVIDYLAISQLKAISLRKDFKYVIGFPDLHAGADNPVGYVMKTGNTLYFDLIGADIGCTVSAQKLALRYSDGSLHPAILGKNIFKGEIRDMAGFASTWFTNTSNIPSIGGGNHFLEFAVDDNNNVWLVVHSGSRGTGGDTFKAIRDELKSLKLFGVPVSTFLGRALMDAFNAALNMAAYNIDCITTAVLREGFPNTTVSVVVTENIKTVHNTIVPRNDGVYHYKGASQVDRDNMKVVIPMNMRDGTLIAEVLHAKELFYGLNHGAGRLMSRSEAKSKLTMDSLDGINVLSNGDVLDEAPDAYKNVTSDMEWMEQAGLIKLHGVLKPIITVKQ